MSTSTLIRTSPSILRLDPGDPIGVAVKDLAQGDATGIDGVAAQAGIPKGHKVALRAIARGEAVRKLGTLIGQASAPIMAGEHVHTHNLAFRPSAASRTVTASRRNRRAPIEDGAASFEGYVREGGRVGTRNVLVVLCTVNCSATVAKRIAETFRRTVDLNPYPTIDGVVALTHAHGCSVRANGPGMDSLRRTLGGYAQHPNVAGVLVVGLGCEDNQIDEFLARAGLQPSPRLKALVIQEEGGTAATIAAGVEALKDMLPSAAAARRRPVPASRLLVGLQCGGSDGFSALTANPALGAAVDLLVEQGGGAILSETPEIYGAEQLLLERVASREVGDKLVELLGWWERNARLDAGDLNANPSPGNKAGGITTILEKSLGAVAKAGSSVLEGVYAYAEPIDVPGLVFMDSPGSDAVSATGQVAAGANLICFTTGRGSCFGAAPVPSLKLATTTGLYARMRGDMDLNCGTILDGTETLVDAGRRIFNLMLEAASGKRTRSEELGYGEEEFVPWTPGLIY
ncbi:MAG: altronate dehydratase [Methylobacteriaceae bacterium]|nr:altronate dehydratase [Methylobacteriaceae bacterium]